MIIRKKTWAPAVAGAIFLVAAAALADAPVIRIERGEACVAPVAEMRRDHMKMLFHQRDRTMRQGVREARASLKGCVECHASQKTGSVAKAETDFCVACHSYAAVKIDCFECHTPLRQKKLAGQP